MRREFLLCSVIARSRESMTKQSPEVLYTTPFFNISGLLRRAIALLAMTLIYLSLISFIYDSPFAQQKKLLHKARTSVVIPGLRREFNAELANISIEVNPGWEAEEIDDSVEHIYQLVFTDPDDSTKKILSLLMQHYESKGFDSLKWNSLKNSIRESYGDRGIALRPLDEQITNTDMQDSSGIIARYELLAKLPDHLEYIDAVVGKISLVLLTMPLKSEEYRQKIGYFRDIAGSIKLGRSK